MKTIHFIGGARPNFIKIAPLLRLFDKESLFNSCYFRRETSTSIYFLQTLILYTIFPVMSTEVSGFKYDI